MFSCLFFLAEEESEAVDAAAAIGEWIDAMGKGIDVKNKATGIGPDKSVITAPAGEFGNFSRVSLGSRSKLDLNFIHRLLN